MIIDSLLWLISLFIILKIIHLSVTPVEFPLPGELMDKFFHITAYFALTLSLLMASVWRPIRGPGPFSNSTHLIFIMCIVFGITLEVFQNYLPFRDGSFLDCLANTIGALLGVFLIKWLRRIFENRLPTHNNLKV